MNVPNALTTLRIVLSPGLALFAFRGSASAFLWLFLALEVTDWLDGKLAVWLDQRSEFGARLDSIADMVMYSLLLGGLVRLEGEVLAGEWPWLVPALGGYALSWILSLARFKQMPSYHTLTAKASYILVIGATIGLLAGDLVWPVRVAAVGVATANLEAVLLTLTLDAPRSDVPSILTLRDDDGVEENRPADG